MTNQTVRLMLNINAGADADVKDLEQLTYYLKGELAGLDGDVDLVRAGETPKKAKAGDPVIWGKLLLALTASGGVLTTLIGVLKSWLTSHERRSVTLEIDGDKLEVTGISSKEQQQLINAWLSRHREILIAND